MKLYSELNLACTGLSSYGWLMYSVVQASYKDQPEFVGIDAIVVNAIGFGFSGFMLVILLFFGRQGKGKVFTLSSNQKSFHIYINIILAFGFN